MDVMCMQGYCYREFGCDMGAFVGFGVLRCPSGLSWLKFPSVHCHLTFPTLQFVSYENCHLNQTTQGKIAPIIDWYVIFQNSIYQQETMLLKLVKCWTMLLVTMLPSYGITLFQFLFLGEVASPASATVVLQVFLQPQYLVYTEFWHFCSSFLECNCWHCCETFWECMALPSIWSREFDWVPTCHLLFHHFHLMVTFPYPLSAKPQKLHFAM